MRVDGAPIDERALAERVRAALARDREARAVIFRPALDDAGTAITARSPPVRVHFTRSGR